VPAKAFIFVGMATFLEHFDIGPIADMHESMLDTRLSTSVLSVVADYSPIWVAVQIDDLVKASHRDRYAPNGQVLSETRAMLDQ
jgi:hypothetical protein